MARGYCDCVSKKGLWLAWKCIHSWNILCKIYYPSCKAWITPFKLLSISNKSGNQNTKKLCYFVFLGTRTDKALKYVRHKIFSDERPDVPKIVILITDGASWYPHLTTNEARLLRDHLNATIFTVAISNKVSVFITLFQYFYFITSFKNCHLVIFLMPSVQLQNYTLTWPRKVKKSVLKFCFGEYKISFLLDCLRSTA